MGEHLMQRTRQLLGHLGGNLAGVERAQQEGGSGSSFGIVPA